MKKFWVSVFIVIIVVLGYYYFMMKDSSKTNIEIKKMNGFNIYVGKIEKKQFDANSFTVKVVYQKSNAEEGSIIKQYEQPIIGNSSKQYFIVPMSLLKSRGIYTIQIFENDKFLDKTVITKK